MTSIIIIILFLDLMIGCSSKQIQNQSSNENLAQERDIASIYLKSIPFEKCNEPKKLYLEKKIEQMPIEYFTDQSKDWTTKIPIQCIQFAQKRFQGSYAYCESENSRPRVGAPKPCLTEKYTQLVYNAYHDIKNCFNLDPKNSFLQIMIESGFHINAINRTGFDAGVSQFTKNGILRATEGNIIERTRRVLLESSSPSCQRIASIVGKFDIDGFKVEKRCSVIALPQNPYRSFLFHYLHTLRDQIFFKQKLVKLRPEIEPILTQEMIEQFVYFAYNRGITGTLNLIDGYYKNRMRSGQIVKSEDFNLFQNLDDVRNTMRREPAMRRLLRKKRIRNLSFSEYAIIENQPYMANMSSTRDLVLKEFGSACTQ